jgi:RimJ/RimL family protein N-acetyltransferase
MTDDIEQMLFNDTVLKTIIEELSHFNLTPKDYITLANRLLDKAINKTEITESPAPAYSDKKITLPIKLDAVVIRKFNYSSDAKILKEWTKSDYGKEFLLSRIDNKEITVDDLINDKLNIFGMIETSEKLPIGVLGFLNHDKANNKAELRKLIGNYDYKEKGLAKRAASAWISYGISSLNLRKIYIYTYDTNIRNIRINRELGFKLEGIFKAENIYNGEPRDIIRMALLAT